MLGSSLGGWGSIEPPPNPLLGGETVSVGDGGKFVPGVCGVKREFGCKLFERAWYLAVYSEKIGGPWWLVLLSKEPDL